MPPYNDPSLAFNARCNGWKEPQTDNTGQGGLMGFDIFGYLRLIPPEDLEPCTKQGGNSGFIAQQRKEQQREASQVLTNQALAEQFTQ